MPWTKSKVFAIRVCEDNLDFIRFLNDGEEVEITEKSTYFLYDFSNPEAKAHREVVDEDDLYDENGHAKRDVTFVT